MTAKTFNNAWAQLDCWTMFYGEGQGTFHSLLCTRFQITHKHCNTIYKGLVIFDSKNVCSGDLCLNARKLRLQQTDEASNVMYSTSDRSLWDMLRYKFIFFLSGGHTVCLQIKTDDCSISSWNSINIKDWFALSKRPCHGVINEYKDFINTAGECQQGWDKCPGST